jgi:hypothetical protein
VNPQFKITFIRLQGSVITKDLISRKSQTSFFFFDFTRFDIKISSEKCLTAAMMIVVATANIKSQNHCS